MPSVFKLSLSMKRIRPRTLAGKPSMICTDPADLSFFSRRRVAVPAGGAFAELDRRRNEPSQRTGGDHSGRGQIHERVAIAHAPFEIPIRGADCSLAFLHESATADDACATDM